jgi:multicomponent K+:H+ antiporter subunit E
MKRVMSSPFLVFSLTLLWPILNQSWSLGHLVLGFVLATLITWCVKPLMRGDERVWSVKFAPVVTLRLLGIIFKDVVMSNIDVAKIILSPSQNASPRFVWVPISIKSPSGIVALASIITMTPGTLSADLSSDRKFLLVHALNCTDEAALIDSIHERYETPLKEIFE